MLRSRGQSSVGRSPSLPLPQLAREGLSKAGQLISKAGASVEREVPSVARKAPVADVGDLRRSHPRRPSNASIDHHPWARVDSGPTRRLRARGRPAAGVAGPDAVTEHQQCSPRLVVEVIDQRRPAVSARVRPKRSIAPPPRRGPREYGQRVDARHRRECECPRSNAEHDEQPSHQRTIGEQQPPDDEDPRASGKRVERLPHPGWIVTR